MKKKCSLVIVLIAVLCLLASCASFQEFSEDYDRMAPYMLDRGLSLSESRFLSDWLIGTWKYTDVVKQVVSFEGSVISESELSRSESTIEVLDVAGAGIITVDRMEQDLRSFYFDKFARTREKYDVAAYSLQASMEYDRAVMCKIETFKDGTGMKESYIYVRTLTKIPSTRTFVVKFISETNKTLGSQTVALGDTVAAPALSDKNGYTFAGWVVEGEVFNIKSPINKNYTLMASWAPIVKEEVVIIPTTYTVSFDTEGGSYINPITVQANGTITAPKSPNKEGYIFNGWYDGNTLFDFGRAINSNVTLKARWAKTVETYAANFFDTKFYYSQCKDVQWYVDGGKINLNSPTMLYNAQKSSQVPLNELSDGSYICFAKTNQDGYYSQTLYAKDGTVRQVLSVKGVISYFGDYGFLYRADPSANNAYTEYCSYFYTTKGLNPNGTTPNSSSFAYKYDTIKEDRILENFGK